MLRYEGRLADQHELDFYDAARAITGFERSLALTAHLVANGEIITQAPSLKNAQIVVSTPRPGSWEIIAGIVGGAFAVSTVKQDNPLGHLIYSVYDYIIRQSLGFPVDYSKSLYQSWKEDLEAKKITPAKLDSLTEKAEGAITDMHRPIIASKTAERADLLALPSSAKRIRLGSELNNLTYDFIKTSKLDKEETANQGIVSSYNINTYSGRLFMFSEERTIAFELEDSARTRQSIDLVASSLRSNAVVRSGQTGNITLHGRRVTSSTGRLKGLRVNSVSDG